MDRNPLALMVMAFIAKHLAALARFAGASDAMARELNALSYLQKQRVAFICIMLLCARQWRLHQLPAEMKDAYIRFLVSQAIAIGEECGVEHALLKRAQDNRARILAHRAMTFDAIHAHDSATSQIIRVLMNDASCSADAFSAVSMRLHAPNALPIPDT